MAKKSVDIVSNSVSASQEIVVENAIGADAGAFAPARALQVGGALASSTNPVPVGSLGIGAPDDTAAASDAANSSLIGQFKRLLGRLTTLFQGTAGTANTNVITVQGIAGAVAQPVSLATLPALTAGSAAIGSVSVSNFPATQPVSLTTLPSGSNAIGSVSVSNFPATQPVSLATLPALTAGNAAIGSVSVSNFPATQPVSLTTLPSGSNAIGSVSVSNFPATQPVSLATLPALTAGNAAIGSVSVSNLPATYPTISAPLIISTAPLLTRPADTTTYVANDVIAAATTGASSLSFPNVGGSGYIVGAKMTRSNTASQLTRFRLYLFPSAPAGQNNNAPFLLNAAERLNRFYIDFTAWQFYTGSDSQESNAFIGASLPFRVASGTSLFGILMALDGFTPLSSETFSIELIVEP